MSVALNLLVSSIFNPIEENLQALRRAVSAYDVQEYKNLLTAWVNLANNLDPKELSTAPGYSAIYSRIEESTAEFIQFSNLIQRPFVPDEHANKNLILRRFAEETIFPARITRMYTAYKYDCTIMEYCENERACNVYADIADLRGTDWDLFVLWYMLDKDDLAHTRVSREEAKKQIAEDILS